MSEASTCKRCMFSLEKLPMQLPASRASKTGGAQSLVIHCPFCGEEVPEVLENRGYFWRASEEKYRYWVDGYASPHDKRDKHSVPISELLELKFGKPAEPLGTMEVCHMAVPCFADGETVQVPTLPVREEYLDCMDERELRRAREGASAHPKDPGWIFGQLKRVDGKMVYVSAVPYKNHAKERWTATKPLPLVTSTLLPQVGGVPVFAGVFVRHWPNLDHVRWRFHLVSFGANPDAMRLLEECTWRVNALVPRLGNEKDGRVEREGDVMRVVPLPPLKPGSRVSTTNCDGKPEERDRDNNRPAWISVSVECGGRGGGLFALPPARIKEVQAAPLIFGLDFGTTNTVLANQDTADKPSTVKPEGPDDRASTTRRVVGRCVQDDPLDLWPGAPWAGPHHDLLPSELMATEPWGSIAVEPAKVDGLKLCVELGIPLRLWSQGSAPEGISQRILSDFKWDRAIREREGGTLANLASRISVLQARFMELAVLMATAWKLCNGRPYPHRVLVNYSYPPAFTKDDLETLEAATKIAERRVEAALGLDADRSATEPTRVSFQLGPDEAQAAVVGESAARMFMVFVDIGGGSLEVLVEDSFAKPGERGMLGHNDLPAAVLSNSLYFGGGVFLRSLVRGGKTCVHSDYTTLAAQVRNLPNGRALFRSQNIFKPGRLDAARKRASVFGEAVADYVARLLAGMCLEHGYQHEPGGAGGERLNLSRNRLFFYEDKRWKLGEDHEGRRRVIFTLQLLGNGWNTVEASLGDGAGVSLEEHFATLVRQRLRQILRAEGALAARIRDESNVSLAQLDFVIECPEVVGKGRDQVPHRKAAVAINLARRTTAEDAKEHFRRGLIGLEFSVGARSIPWHRPCGAAMMLPAKNHPKRTSPRASVLPSPTASQAPSAPPVGLSTRSEGPPPRARWYLGDVEPPRGPFSTAQLVDLALEGRSETAARRLDVWCAGAAWEALEKVPELLAELAGRAKAAPVEPAGPPPRRVWFVAEPGGETGPWTVPEVIEKALLAGHGQAAAAGAMEVWRDGLPGWKRLDAEDDLRAALERKVTATRPPVRPPPRTTSPAEPPKPPPRRAAPPPPPRRAAPKEWHLDDGVEASGPWTESELAEKARAGRDVDAALALLVWREGMAEWSPLAAVDALASAVRGRDG